MNAATAFGSRTVIAVKSVNSSLSYVTRIMAVWMCAVASLANGGESEFAWELRYQTASEEQGSFQRLTRSETWTAESTAVIVCDVWDKHHCLNAVRRLEEFGPRLNQVIQESRKRGAVIIHAPSDCMAAYDGHPARLRAQQVPPAASLPEKAAFWCSRIPAEEKAVYPIDQSDGGDDDHPDEHAAWATELTALGRNPGMPWKSQSSMIEIDDELDFISDRGDEIWNILEQRGIRNVLLTGVHTNMCVLGRPFGLRQMVRNGKNVALMRDMTDSMYNPARWPYTDHFTGNDLIISHVERYICPTVTSDQILGDSPFRSQYDKRPERDLTELPQSNVSTDISTDHWQLTELPETTKHVVTDLSDVDHSTAWYRCGLSVSSSWLAGRNPGLLVIPPLKGTVRVWLNGMLLKGIEPLCLSCSAPEPVRYPLSTSAVVADDANLLVIRIQSEKSGPVRLQPPVLISGANRLSLNGRWQMRTGDNPNWSNIPLPARFGLPTDIFFDVP